MGSVQIPIIQFFEWDIGEVASPVGHRHIPGSIGFRQILASGCQTSDPLNLSSTSGTLHFRGTKFTVVDGNPPSHIESSVSAFTVNLRSSGVGIANMKLFLRDDSALRVSMDQGLDPAIVQMSANGLWVPGFTMPSGSYTQLTTAVPSIQNIYRQNGDSGLEGTDDINSSQFVYLNIIIPFGTPLGEFGICGSGALRLGLAFDYFPIVGSGC
jgi:hypothetical protein